MIDYNYENTGITEEFCAYLQETYSEVFNPEKSWYIDTEWLFPHQIVLQYYEGNVCSENVIYKKLVIEF